ncbi:acyltransferase [Telmatobacter sp. DSM 110680]|uniref:Acyltransferase n=1 Tax=Telmatobacter sp. DSM 110680 TaxID=3036704 RepID=A0AAU7DS67_9BACT
MDTYNKSFTFDRSKDWSKPITSVRFLAAVYIIAFHWIRLMPIRELSGFGFRFAAALGGVGFFYFLSGFVLAWVYLRPSQPIDKRRFFVARFARVYPVFLLTLVADLPWFFASHVATLGYQAALAKTGSTFAASLLLLQAWYSGFWGMDTPNWSLSAEAFFYVLFPFLGVWIWSLRSKWTWVSIFLVYIGGQTLVVLVLAAAIAHHASSLGLESLLYLPPLHVSTFILGILMARLQVSSIERYGTGPLAPWAIYSALGAGLAICFGVAHFTSDKFDNSMQGSILLRDGSMAPLFCVIVWALSSGSTVVSRLLSVKWLVFLGNCSFGLYLIHLPILHVLGPAMQPLLWGRSHSEFWLFYILLFLLYLALCIPVSIASFYWVETPARRWISVRFNARRSESLEAGFPVGASAESKIVQGLKA